MALSQESSNNHHVNLWLHAMPAPETADEGSSSLVPQTYLNNNIVIRINLHKQIFVRKWIFLIFKLLLNFLSFASRTRRLCLLSKLQSWQKKIICQFFVPISTARKRYFCWCKRSVHWFYNLDLLADFFFSLAMNDWDDKALFVRYRRFAIDGFL